MKNTFLIVLFFASLSVSSQSQTTQTITLSRATLNSTNVWSEALAGLPKDANVLSYEVVGKYGGKVITCECFGEKLCSKADTLFKYGDKANIYIDFKLTPATAPRMKTICYIIK